MHIGMSIVSRTSPAALAAGLLLLTAGQSSAQQSVEAFYKGKTVTITVGGTPGGGYDNDARVVGRHLGRFVPGHPNFIIQNMPGAKGLTNANRLYQTAPRDGTWISVLQRGLISAPWLNPQGVQFDVQKLNWLFSSAAEPGVAIVWSASSNATSADLRNQEIVIGGAGDSAIIPQVYNYTTGSRFKLVTGYPGTSDVVLAMERGEVQGIGYYSSSNIFERNRSWLTEGKVRVLLQTGSKRHPELPDVPLVSDLALNETKRQVQDLWLAPLETARPFAMPQDVPKDRVAAIQAGFAAMLKDPDFQTDAKNSGMVVDPRSAEEIRTIISMIAKSPRNVIDEARRAVQEE